MCSLRPAILHTRVIVSPATLSISIFTVFYEYFILYIFFFSITSSKSRHLYANNYIKDIFYINVFVILSNMYYIYFSFAKPVI
jgi:hypothetical protein